MDRRRCVLFALVVGCFKSTPITPAPATPEEAIQIRAALDGTVWYARTYREGDGPEKAAAEVFVFAPGDHPFGVTAQYREAFGNYAYDDIRTNAYRLFLDGKNVRLKVPGLEDQATSARSLRIERSSPEAMELFDYDFTRIYTLQRFLPDRKPVTSAVGNYTWIRVAPSSSGSGEVAERLRSCVLEAPPTGKSVQGGCHGVKEGNIDLACDVGDPGEPLACHFTQKNTNWGGEAALRLNPDGSLVGSWRTPHGEMKPLILLRHPS